MSVNACAADEEQEGEEEEEGEGEGEDDMFCMVFRSPQTSSEWRHSAQPA
jgi:hypothetical protein